MRTVVLVGSGKPTGTSTSEALASHLVERLPDREVHWLHARQLLTRPEILREAVRKADLLVVASPIYIDSLPYPLVAALEALATDQIPVPVVALLNCGFPEASHCDVGAEVLRLFTERIGGTWLGALRLGGGEALHGQRLEEAGGVTRAWRRSLEETAAAVSRGAPVPEEAAQRMARPFVPAFLYRWMGGMGWRRLARRAGVTDLNAKPYE